MNHKILITGASGLIGTRLTELLLQKDYQVCHVGRNKRSGLVPSFVWNIETGDFDVKALQGVDTIIHLAGAGVADKRWTSARKKEILDSRLKSTNLLFKILSTQSHSVKTFISASAIGYYGFGLSEEIYNEESKSATDFLAQVTAQWESAANSFQLLAIRTVKIRIGIVLSERGGALTQMAMPIKLGVGSPLGSGKQYLSWIHIDDLCNIFVKSVEDDTMQGAYNAVVDWSSNKDFTMAIANTLRKPLWLPKVPSFILKLILGEMADIIVNGRKVSSEKIRKAGFVPAYPTLDLALQNLLN